MHNGAGDSLAALSKMLGHAPGYYARFVGEGFPCALSRRDRRLLKLYDKVSEREMRIRDLERATRAARTTRGYQG